MIERIDSAGVIEIGSRRSPDGKEPLRAFGLPVTLVHGESRELSAENGHGLNGKETLLVSLQTRDEYGPLAILSQKGSSIMVSTTSEGPPGVEVFAEVEGKKGPELRHLFGLQSASLDMPETPTRLLIKVGTPPRPQREQRYPRTAILIRVEGEEKEVF